MARDQVGYARCDPPQRAHFAQQRVAGLVAVRVVVGLETVEVEHHDVQRVAKPRGARQLAAQLLLPGAAVGKLRQLVGARDRLDAAQQLVALALGLHALADVAHDARVERVGGGLPGDQTELQRERTAVLALPDQLDGPAGALGVLAREELLDLEAIGLAVALSQQDEEALAQHLVRAVAERALSGGIELRDASARVSRDDRVDRDVLHVP